jgi:hypothetical protein
MYQDESPLAPHPTKSALLYNLYLRSGRASLISFAYGIISGFLIYVLFVGLPV